MGDLSIKHVAIIPDGNRRWARSRGFPAFIGHYEGLKAAERILKAGIAEEGVSHITIWGASIDNLLKRPKEEVSHLNEVFSRAAALVFEKAAEMPEGTRLFIKGEWENYLPDSIKRAFAKINEESAKKNGYLTVTALLAYSGKRDMIRAIRKIKEEGLEINDEIIVESLSTGDLPPVDLLIRTGGEPHNSDGFMMWQTANTALYFTETLWPDFTAREFSAALAEVRARERRLGK